MASLMCRRAVFRLAKRSLHTSVVVRQEEEKQTGYDPRKFPDPLDHATGIEKAEMIANMQGNEDPFDTRIQKRGPGTKDCPNLVGSYFNSRLVGCICEEDQVHINWMWLHKGQPRRCECGYWFKLIDREPIEVPVEE